MSINEQFFFLSPVQAVKVTAQNLDEVAEWCGGLVAQTESRKRPGTMDKYVAVPTPEGAKMGLAFLGMYVTRRVAITARGESKITWAVYAKGYFKNNYFDTPAESVEKTWGRKQKKAVEASKKVSEVVPETESVVNSDRTVTVVVEVQGAEELQRVVEQVERIGQGLEKVSTEVVAGSELGRDASL